VFLHGKKKLGKKTKKKVTCNKILVHLKEFEPFLVFRKEAFLFAISPPPLFCAFGIILWLWIQLLWAFLGGS
jgi:hypothetical protein